MAEKHQIATQQPHGQTSPNQVNVQMGYGSQPPPQQSLARPEPTHGCPPGLEYLLTLDQMLVKQQMELLEVMTGWESENKYEVLNSKGQQIYFAAEETGTWMRQFCGAKRGFTIHITDNHGQEIIRVKRVFKCCAGCCWCACRDCIAHEISVEAPVGQIVGYVRQEQSFWEPHYTIRDADHLPVLRMKGPCCIISGPCCTWDQEFLITSQDGAHDVGKISKQWGGFTQELISDADNFALSFPKDLDVKLKATLLGAVFLIDFMFFEQKKDISKNSRYA